MTCAEVMTPNPTCCTADQTIDEAAQMMRGVDVGLLPVVTDRSSKLIGVLTDREIVMKVVTANRDARSTTVSQDGSGRGGDFREGRDDHHGARDSVD